jgi:phosphatidylethanolamine/phosphatidyl-N-methylethanolamine N-methyltransferase
MTTHPQDAKLYGRFAGIYDAVFRRFFRPRIRRTLEHMRLEPGMRVLDLGAGTGISLPLYPDGVEVTAVDLSAEMLRQAAEKVNERGLDNVELARMDAQRLGFEDDAFDAVLISFVVSVVPDPHRLMEEAIRVTRPGGRIAVVNHFRSPYPAIGQIEDTLDRFCRRLGWNTVLRLDPLIENLPLRVTHRYRLRRILDPWTIVVAINERGLPPCSAFQLSEDIEN